MFDKAVSNTAIRYGVTGGIVTVVYIVALALLGLENPYGNVAELSSIVLFVPVVVFLAVRYYKKFNEAGIGFGRAFKVGLATTLVLACTTAILIYIFSWLAGSEFIEQYIILEQENMRLTKTEVVKWMGEANYQNAYAQIGEMSASKLAQRAFMFRLLAGLLVTVVSSVFLRK